MKLSRFVGKWDEVPKPLDCSWAYFTENMSVHDYSYTDKFSCPAFSPCEYKPNTTRGSANVIALHQFVIDLDEVTEEQAMSVLLRVNELGLASLAYTTWSHAENPWRMRVAIPLSKPVPASAWPEFWQKANAYTLGLCDPQCKDPARLFFGPFAPAGTEDVNFTVVSEGVPLDVDSIFAVPALIVAETVEPTEKLSAKLFETFAKQMTRRTHPKQADLGQKLMLVCKGESFAESGNRDNVIFQLSCVLAERFLDFTAASIAEHFTLSLQLMATESAGCPTVADVAYKINRQQVQLRAEAQTAKQGLEDEYSLRIREAFKNGRSDPYTEEELKAFGPITHRWLLQKNKSVYLFFNGAYEGPYAESDAWNAARRSLAPARTAGIELFTVDEQGVVRPKPMKSIVDAHGTIAEKVILDLSAQKSYYDEKERAIVEAPCPIRKDLVPTFFPEIDEGLQIFAGAKYPKLCRWLSALPRLEFPLPALFVTGRRAVGKSLIANGPARIWHKGPPTPLQDALGDFNEALARCPLTFADEKLPKDTQGRSRSADLRVHIQEQTRQYRRKFLPNSELRGCTRTIVAANNESILETKEKLNDEDLRALQERYFWIRVNPAAAEFLKTQDARSWVLEDKLARHCLWLYENYSDWESEGRFLLAPEDDDVFLSLMTRSGYTNMVCQWFTMFLLDPAKFTNDARSNLFVRVHQGKLLANVQGLVRCWDTYISNASERCPPMGDLGMAMASLCDSSARPKLTDAKGERINYRVVDIRHLIVYAEQFGIADKEQILAALEKETEVV